MTRPLDDPRALASSGTRGTVLRWSLAAATVAASYAAAIWLAFALPLPEGVQGEPQDAVMIELEPMTATEEAPPPAPEPQVVEEPIEEPTPAPVEPPVEEALPEPPPEPAAEAPTPPDPIAPEEIAPPEEPPEPVIPEPVVEEPPPAAEPVSEPKPEPVDQPEPLPEPTSQEVVPDLIETDAIAAAVLNPPIPTARPPPRPVETVERKPRAETRKERRKAEPAKKPERPRTVAQTRAPVSRSSAARSDPPAATRSASAPRASSASWQRSLLNHLRKYSSPTQAKGTTRITVVFDGSGRVTQASIAGSSGNATLDRETLALVRRASPFPPPSDGDVGRSVTIPIRIR